MAEEKADKKPRIRKSAPTKREQSEAIRTKSEKPKRVRGKTTKVTSSIKRPISALSRVGSKTYYLPMPDNRVGRFLNKRRRFIPKYFADSWVELRQVTWTGRRETWRLTSAVFVFAIIFGLMVAIVDKGVEELFRTYVLK